jgi:ABC-type sugar transport system permease subunit
MEKAQLLFKRILPVLMAVFILIPLVYSAYVSFYLKSRAASLDKEFEVLSRRVPVKTEIKYKRFEESENYKKTLAKLDSMKKQFKKSRPLHL